MRISIQRYRSTGNIRKSFRRRIVSSRMIIPALFIGCIILLACMHIWQRVYVLNLVREVRLLEKENKRIKDIVKKSNIEVIELSSLERIEKVATEDLKLVKTQPENIITMAMESSPHPREGINEVVSSLKKIAENLPVLTESKASAVEIFESDER